MSYDLYFYKRRGTNLLEEDIKNYLTDNLISPQDNASQWFFQNPDTEVYFCFDENEEESDPDTIALYENFADFENTNFAFNLNFIRADFFGIEAFRFVDKFIEDLNLYVLNLQSSENPDGPHRPTIGELYQEWSTSNSKITAHNFNECDLLYFPTEKSNAVWAYNFNRRDLQNKLGNGYFVPKIFFFRSNTINQIITVTSWTENIPCILPNVDFYLIVKKYKSFFSDVEEVGTITAQTLNETFSEFFEKFEDSDCKIIHDDQTFKTLKKFNSLKLDKDFRSKMERVPIEKVVNSKPENN